MANILKIIRGLVKTIALVISLAFIVNGLTGITTVVNLVDNNGVSVQDINPGDFTLKYNNLSIDIGITINNSGIYDMESVKMSMVCELKSNISTEWHEVIDTASSDLGVTIEPGEVIDIDIAAEMVDFSQQPGEIAASLGITDPSWDLADLLNTAFEIRVYLEFTIAYAFGQYDITVAMDLTTADLEIGF
ncbi:MAG: hypothetical protein ACTSVZ_13690 [Promethearchaeota archaeon]